MIFYWKLPSVILSVWLPQALLSEHLAPWLGGHTLDDDMLFLACVVDLH